MVVFNSNSEKYGSLWVRKFDFLNIQFIKSIQRYAYTRVLMEKRFLSVRTHEIEIETLRHCVSCRKFKSLIDRSARAHLLAISGFRHWCVIVPGVPSEECENWGCSLQHGKAYNYASVLVTWQRSYDAQTNTLDAEETRYLRQENCEGEVNNVELDNENAQQSNLNTKYPGCF